MFKFLVPFLLLIPMMACGDLSDLTAERAKPEDKKCECGDCDSGVCICDKECDCECCLHGEDDSSTGGSDNGDSDGSNGGCDGACPPPD